MAETFCPRISEAKQLLPLLRTRIVAMSSAHPLPKGMSIELVPIVEDGLFGFEIVPDRESHTYLIIGCNAQGAPVVREILYDSRAPNALQLVAVDGQRLSRREREARFRDQRRDSHFNDWPDAVDGLWSRLATLFPGHPRQVVALPDARNRSLEGALSVAWTYLAPWDPFITFCGLPNEAEQGFALGDANSGHGVLVYQRPDIWMLRWKAPPDAIYESWSVVLQDVDVERNAGDSLAS